MAPNAFDYIAINNTLARFSLALDTKDFGLLKNVFTEDGESVFPWGGRVKGVEAIATAVQDRLQHVTTQHALTTQHIEITEDGRTATSTTYFNSMHFGQGKWEGKEAWGKYVDSFKMVPGHSVPGASGQWLIARREVTFMGRRGEEGVMKGE